MQSELEIAKEAYLAGDLPAALKVLRQLQESLVPAPPEVLLRLGQVYFKMDQHVQAQGCFQEAVRLDPQRFAAPAWEGIVECLLASPTNSDKHITSRIPFLEMAAQAYVRQGKHADAQRCWRRILSLQPKHEDALEGLRGLDGDAPEIFGWVG